MEDFQLYSDKQLTEKVSDPINLGKVKAGETKTYTFYVYNASVYPYEELNFSVDHDEVAILSFPVELQEKSSAEVVLEWKPSVDIKRGLKTTLKIAGYQVIG
jgi:hypothetical protein